MSYIIMSADDVRTAAQACLDGIVEHRTKAKGKLIAAEQRRAERSWWRRLFRLPVPTAAQIEADLDGYLSSPLLPIKLYAWGSEQTAQKLLKAAKHASDGRVHVSAKDLEMIL